MTSRALWSILPLAAVLTACGQTRLPATPLFAGLDGTSYAEGTRLIKQRLLARFPNGSPERGLQAYLAQQGLHVEHVARPSEPDSGTAVFTYGGPVCGSRIRVIWSADGSGRIQNIDALFGDTGCL